MCRISYTTYDVAVYASSELRSWCSNNYSNATEAQERAQEYIEGAFGYVSNYSVNVTIVDTDVPAPVEHYDQSFQTGYPCDPWKTVDYNNLYDWWKDWMDCQASVDAADSNILITSTDQSDGGRAGTGGTRAVAQVGRYLARAPTNYTTYGCYLKHSAAETVLHEIAHNFTDGSIYDDYPNTNDPAHKLGREIYHSEISGYAYTPLATKGQDNVCERYVPNADTCWQLHWADCCENHWRNPN